MKRVVVDASVAIKWFIPEIHSEIAARLLDPEYIVSAPDLIRAELGNTVWKKVRRREITATEAAEVIAAFQAVGIQVYPSEALLAPAFDVAVALGRTVYDSLYLALAVSHDCPLITADRRFHAAVLESPLASHIRWIEDEW